MILLFISYGWGNRVKYLDEGFIAPMTGVYIGSREVQHSTTQSSSLTKVLHTLNNDSPMIHFENLS